MNSILLSLLLIPITFVLIIYCNELLFKKHGPRFPNGSSCPACGKIGINRSKSLFLKLNLASCKDYSRYRQELGFNVIVRGCGFKWIETFKPSTSTNDKPKLRVVK